MLPLEMNPTALTRAAADMQTSQIETQIDPSAALKVQRTLLHRRTFCFEVYERDDGLWDIDAQMQDRKSYPFTLASHLRPAAEPIHSMVLRITVNSELEIVAVHAHTAAAPYLTQCQHINPDYQKMLGLNVKHGFRAAIRERFAGTAGCTHLTELANTLPTVVIQGVGVELAVRKRQAQGDEHTGRPFQINQCHALSEAGEAVQRYYPRWYRPNVPLPTHQSFEGVCVNATQYAQEPSQEPSIPDAADDSIVSSPRSASI
jgi:Protein of unknown function (DUF2889)